MTDAEMLNYIDLAIQKTIAEYKRSGMLRDSRDVSYADACEVLADYYTTGKKDARITYAIQGQRFDPYFLIIPMFYEEGKTIEFIAEKMGVDISTIVRNKKRLCLAIYDELV